MSTRYRHPFAPPFARDKAGVAEKPATPVVLSLCIHIAGRSVAARGLLDHYAAGRVTALSAGSEPGQAINPAVVQVLSERGLDASREFPKPLTDQIAVAADVVVTDVPVSRVRVPGTRYLDWPVEDRAGLEVDAVRTIVDDMDRRVHALLGELIS